MILNSVYDIELNSSEGFPHFLQQFKGKAAIIVNTTVGCGNANQMEVLQQLQEIYGGDHFEIIAIPTNDYCGPGVTKGEWSRGISCGLDSQNYGKKVYGATFKFSEMVSSIPNEEVSKDLNVEPGHNGLGQPNGIPHDLYKTIRDHQLVSNDILRKNGLNPNTMFKDKYFSYWLNQGFYSGTSMGGNFEKYLIDKDGYVYKHYTSTTLNLDVEKTLKESEQESLGYPTIGLGRSKKIFEEEWAAICQDIEDMIAGKKSIVNPPSTTFP